MFGLLVSTEAGQWSWGYPKLGTLVTSAGLSIHPPG